MSPRPALAFALLGCATFAAAPDLSFAGDKPPGLPVKSELVRNACGACHQPDDQGRMSRISYQRKTPEGWQITLKRMVRTGQVQLTPEDARAMVRYLADHHGLAPAEARPFSYEAEKRPTLEAIGGEMLRDVCTRCHTGARFLSQRRAPEEWKLLKGMHLGYFPLVEFQGFRRRIPQWELPREPGSEESLPESEPPAHQWRADMVLDDLAKRYPLDSPEWRAFLAKRTEPDLSGRWLLVTYQPARGLVAGEVSIEKEGDDYVTRAELWLPDGSEERREGRGVLYTGYSWRGRSSGAGLGELREVMMLSENGTSLDGRFFKGAFGELGLDVTLTRLGSDSRIAGVWPRALLSGTGQATLRILGANLPERVPAGEIDLGPGVNVKAVSSSGPNVIEVQVEVAKEALPGLRDVSLEATTTVDGFAVYDKVDYVKVRPEEGMARLGGGSMPKQFVQFEAVAFHRGPDGEPLTGDDIELGPLEASWSLEEYHVRPEDDDLKYVGEIDQKGLFTPSIEGPNPERGGTNNYGDVWAVATYAPPGAARPLRGRAHLLVTVPLYTYWELFP